MAGRGDGLTLVARLGEALAPAGLDRVHAFDIARYNSVAETHATLQPVPAFGRAQALAVLVANTRALWPRFVTDYARDQALQREADPLDAWVAARVRAAVASTGVAAEVRLASDTGERLTSMLHAAEASDFARVGPAHLAVHPSVGPWFALRALVVFDAPPPDDTASETDVCATCAAPCRPAMDRAMTAYREAGSVVAVWRDWIAVRDACPVGRIHRYGPNQLRYHYTKDRAFLRLDESPE